MKRKNQKAIFGLSLGLMLLFSVVTFGQDQSLIEISNETELSLKEEHSGKIENLKQNKLYKSVELIKLGNIAKLSKTNNGALPVKIPGVNKSYVAKPVEIEYTSEENFIWKGEFNTVDGYVKLICKEGEIFGNIQIGNRFFEIQAFEPGKNVIIEYDEKELAKMTCGNIHEEENTSESMPEERDLKSATAITTRATVRVLVLYTDAAQAVVTNINNTAYLAVSQMNDAINNSAVNSSLYMTLAGVQHLQFTETASIVDDVNNLSTNATAVNLRNTNEADLVVLLTDGNYTYGSNTVYGVVDEIGPDNANAYAIVEADCATSSNYTFAHEVGHLFGGLHNNHTIGSYEHGYEFKTGIWPFRNTRTTVMYVSPGDYILHYSNPDVEYKNKATGTTSYNDVARKLETEASTVEAFRSFTAPLDVYISGPDNGNNSGTYTWYANVSNGTPPYTYLWEYSYDGFNYLGIFGRTSSVTSQLPYGYDLYLRLTVNSSDGQQYIDFHTTINLDAGGPEYPKSATINLNDSISDIKAISKELTENFSLDMPGISVFPNPVQNNATISYYINEKCKVSLEIFDINGKKVETIINNAQDKGKYLTQLNTSKYKSGVYFCKLSLNGQTFSKKIIVE